MKKNLLLVTFLCCCLPAFAQRTTRGTFTADVKFGTTYYSWMAGISGGLYNLRGYYYADLTWADYTAISQKGSRYNCAPLTLDIGYMYRVYGTQTRNLNAYVGGSVFLGGEFPDPYKRLPSDEILVIKNKFIYGIRPRIAGEWFFWNSLALVLQVDVPFTINSQYKLATCNTMVGLRYNF